MTTDTAYEIKLAVNELRRRHTPDELREAFMAHTLDSTLLYIGRLASERFLAEHVYIWIGFEIVIGHAERVFDVPFVAAGDQE